jgi:glycosyltransferase involved in cell wall biosynthesis
VTDVDVVVAVLTYRRLVGVGELLHQLVEQLAESELSASIVVVDNDGEPTAADVVAGFASVRYVHEPRPGIVAARNRALDEAGSARLLVFIDDDERPEPGWLDSIVSTWRLTEPAAVVGPVISVFEIVPDPWIPAGRFFQRQRYQTGTEVPAAGAGNLLLDLEAVRSLGLRFDERFGTSGGEDTFFTRSIVRAGHRIVWCDEAVAIDVVPAHRLTRAWVLERARRIGNSRSRVSVLTADPGLERVGVRARLLAQAAIRLAGGGGRLLLGKLLKSSEHHARGAKTFARGQGMLVGALGGVIFGYGRSDQDILGDQLVRPAGDPVRP